MPRTKASFSYLYLLDFETSLARKLRFHIFTFWNLTDALHESFVFTNHGCDLNGRICSTHCVFRVSGASAAEKSRIACETGAGVIALAWTCSRSARAVELMVPGDFFSSLLTLCFCVLHVLKHFLHWNRCVQRMFSRVVRCHSFVLCNSV